jgi:heme A synthase
MTAAITGLVVSILTFLLWWARRKIETPKTKLELLNEAQVQVRGIVGREDVAGLNKHVDDRLREIGNNSRK